MRWDTNYLKPEPINDPVVIPAYGVTDEERAYWNAKQEALEYDPVPTPYSDKHMISGAIYNALQQYKLTTVQLCQDFYWGVAGGLAQTKEACEAAATRAETAEHNADGHAASALASMNSAYTAADNASDYATLAQNRASDANASKLAAQAAACVAIEDELKAEAWAVGTRDGVPVDSDDPAYHNNSKYYAELGQDVINDSITTLYTTWSSEKINTQLSGKASLVNGKVPAAELPGFVDDVVEYATTSDFPNPGEAGKLYVDLSTNTLYRWSGTVYVDIPASLALGETAGTAYEGNKGKANADAISAIEALIPTGASSSDKLVKNSDLPTVPTALSDLSDDATHRTVSDTEKSAWNGKAETSDISSAISTAFNGVTFTTVNNEIYINW